MLIPRRCLQYGIRAVRPQAIQSLSARTFSSSQQCMQSMPPNSDTTNAEQPGLEYGKWKQHWDRLGRHGQKAATKSFYEREKMATPDGTKSQLDIQREGLTKQLKNMFESFVKVVKTMVANGYMPPSMSPMISSVLSDVEKGVSEFPHNRRALTAAEIGMAKLAFNLLVKMITDVAGMRDVKRVHPKIWADIEMSLKHEQKKEDSVINPFMIQKLEISTQLACLGAKTLAYTFKCTMPDGPVLGPTVDLYFEKLIDVFRPALLRYMTDEEFSNLVSRADDLAKDISVRVELHRWTNEIEFLLLMIKSSRQPASPAERFHILTNLNKLVLQRMAFPDKFALDGFEELSADADRVLGL
ncbi:hypothetical protein Vi05172_g5066 [Venturia inaequalis]|nr:hypothetical protein Vi05172_g5066 [Venturia inaequalis]